MSYNYFWSKRFWVKNILGPKEFWNQKNGVQKILCQKKFLVRKTFWLDLSKLVVPTGLDLHQLVLTCPNMIWRVLSRLDQSGLDFDLTHPHLTWPDFTWLDLTWPNLFWLDLFWLYLSTWFFKLDLYSLDLFWLDWLWLDLS